MIIYELQQKYNDKWLHVDFFSTYKFAQESFIHEKGLFRIQERKVNEERININA